MKKIFILVLMVLVGISLLFSNLKADEARTIPHKFVGYSASTAVAQSRTIFRITGYATGANASFGIYDAATLATADATTIAVEGGEATSGDALPHMYFGEDGISLGSGATVKITNCIIAIEYI